MAKGAHGPVISAGEVLRRSIVAALPDGFVLDAKEQAALEQAAAAADRIAELEAVIAVDGLTTRGSRGQIVLHPCVSEVRAQRLVVLRALRAVELPTPDAVDLPASRRGRQAAAARWERQARNRRLRSAS